MKCSMLSHVRALFKHFYTLNGTCNRAYSAGNALVIVDLRMISVNHDRALVTFLNADPAADAADFAYGTRYLARVL